MLARGAGRSHGDAAQNAGGVVLAPVTAPRIDLDPAAPAVRVSASTSFTDLLTRIVPEGLLLPVLPATCHLTVGGAVAADVHGKNQRTDGSLARWIEEIEILDGQGEVRRLTPDGDPEGFRATVGGMGLTGIILGATIRLLRIRSAQMLVSSRRLADLDAVLTAMDESRDRYCVGRAVRLKPPSRDNRTNAIALFERALALNQEFRRGAELAGDRTHGPRP